MKDELAVNLPTMVVVTSSAGNEYDDREVTAGAGDGDGGGAGAETTAAGAGATGFGTGAGAVTRAALAGAGADFVADAGALGADFSSSIFAFRRASALSKLRLSCSLSSCRWWVRGAGQGWRPMRSEGASLSHLPDPPLVTA